MKITNRFCIVVMLCLGVLLQCSGAYAANFVEIFRSDRYLIFLDVSSLEDHGDYVTVWEKWIYRGRKLEEMKKKFGEKIAYDIALNAYKKNTKESQSLSCSTYDNNGIVLFNYNLTFSPYKFEPIFPESIGEFLWGRVMALTNH